MVVGDAQVASVALALAIPFSIDGGNGFPARDDILFIAFAVVLSTLLVQGLTLPWLVRRLRVRADTDAVDALERELALRVIKASKRRLKEILEVEELPEEVSDQLARRAYDMGARIAPDIVDDERRELFERRISRMKKVHRIQGEMLSAARHEVLAARSEPGTDPEIVDRVLRHLDVRSLRHTP